MTLAWFDFSKSGRLVIYSLWIYDILLEIYWTRSERGCGICIRVGINWNSSTESDGSIYRSVAIWLWMPEFQNMTSFDWSDNLGKRLLIREYDIDPCLCYTTLTRSESNIPICAKWHYDLCLIWLLEEWKSCDKWIWLHLNISQKCPNLLRNSECGASEVVECVSVWV